jgi:predicted RNA-binding protein with RPS1 domain
MMSGDPAGESQNQEQNSASAPAHNAVAASSSEQKGSDATSGRATGPLAARLNPGTAADPVAIPSVSSPVAAANPTAASTMSRDEQVAEAAGADPADSRDGDHRGGSNRGRGGRGKGPRRGDREDRGNREQEVRESRSKVNVPNIRGPLDDDLQADLEAAMMQADLKQLITPGAGPSLSAPSEGQRISARVIKVHGDSVFVSLGGPHEGIVPELQFAEPVEPGMMVDVVVRGFSAEDGLYMVVVPGKSIQVEDWSDLEEGAVVDVVVTGVNSGGLEVKVGSVDGFMPAGQVSEHRIEDFSEFVGQRMTCTITESSERRRKLIVSRRAILEREREEKRKEQLSKINVGDIMEGTVRTIKDFGAFVDLGGLEGLIHISRMSWDRIKHPSEVMEEGQRVRVKLEKIDPETGKIGLSYRDLLDHPWDGAAQKYPVGATVRGTVTRIAAYGAFVRIASGVEGLVHVSELAHHRVFKVDNVVKEGEEVEVKVLSVDPEAQKISLSLKATQAKPESEKEKAKPEVEEEGPPPEPVVKRQHTGPLKGGTDRPSGGESIGLRW